MNKVLKIVVVIIVALIVALFFVPLLSNTLYTAMPIDKSCNTDADCKITPIYRGCGGLVECTNKSYDPSLRDFFGKMSGVSSPCIVVSIRGCECKQNKCTPTR